MEQITNKRIGNDFEKWFCQTLYDNGFWVLNIPQTKAGQAADVIAVKKSHPYLIDCKVCQDDVFDLNRIEANQDTAMSIWHDYCLNPAPWFAVYLKQSGLVFMISHPLLTVLRKDGITRLKSLDFPKYGTEFTTWLKR